MKEIVKIDRNYIDMIQKLKVRYNRKIYFFTIM